MKFTLSWLKDHLDTSASVQEIADTLTAIGLEVERVVDRGAALRGFSVARVLAAEPHPQADKLKVCRVASGKGELQIVCGAGNARAGICVVLAEEGATVPASGMVIRKTKIRGVESNGMLCSAEELSLPSDSAGIMELPDDAQLGATAAGALGLDDPVIEIAVTPNRADCLGVYGIARDLAAAGLGTLHPRAGGDHRLRGDKSPISVTIDDTARCPQFIGCHIRNVVNGESPAWLKKRLEAVGLRPISALVDITNYLTFDQGRPLHVYDAGTLQGNITVRQAKEGERLKALDGEEYALSSAMTVIADASGPVAIAGVIGGQATGCSPATTNVFLEAALFDPAAVARTGRALNILSDARYRFERGVDPAFVETGAQLAIHLIREICGGEAGELVYAGKTPEWRRSITFNPERVKTLGGVDIPAERNLEILTALGFTTDHEPRTANLTVTPPSWRRDVEGEADLVEEVLRIHGYGHIPTTPLPLPSSVAPPAVPISQQRAYAAKRALTGRGLMEVCSWSFLPEAHAKAFGGGASELKLLNPISAELDTMRPSLLPNLLEAARKNAFRGFKDAGLFEVGLQFHGVAPDGQRLAAAGARVGMIAESAHEGGLFQRRERPADSFDAKADALAVLRNLGVAACDVTPGAPGWYHPGRCGTFMLGKTVLGHFGELHPGLSGIFALEAPTAVFEIFLGAPPPPRAKGKARPALAASDFQAVTRDFAFIADAAVPAAAIEKAIRKADKQLITGVVLFDVYAGRGVEPGKKSVAVQVTLQAPDRTLSAPEITAAAQAIIAAADKEFGGRLRQ